MNAHGEFRRTFGAMIWLSAVTLALFSVGYCVRSAMMTTRDLIACGRYPTTYLYVTLHWRRADIRLSLYDPAAFPVADPPHNFFIRSTGLSMAAATPGATFDAQKRSGWEHLNVTRSYIKGRELHTEYSAGIPYVVPMIAALSIAYAALRRPFRKKRSPGLCPVCSYDLRAHEAGERCPECRTVIEGKGAERL
jgi:hypothetical protein